MPDLLSASVEDSAGAMKAQEESADIARKQWESGFEAKLANQQAVGQLAGMAAGAGLAYLKGKKGKYDAEKTPGTPEYQEIQRHPEMKGASHALDSGDPTGSDDHSSLIGALLKRIFGGILGRSSAPIAPTQNSEDPY